MKLLGTMIAFLALCVLLLPALTAQDAKKDEAKKDEVKKDEAKKDEKKDPEKKDEKKDPEKKAEKKAEKKKEEKLVYGQKINAKLARIADNSAREFAIDMPELDPMKVFQFQQWQMQQIVAIAQQQDAKQRAQSMYNYQFEMAKKQSNPQTLHTMKPVDMRAVEDIKVRTMYPPVQYDDQGNLIKWTAKKIAEMRSKDKLPGFAADLDALKAGQYVDVYLAKQAPMPKTLPKKKGGAADDDIPMVVRPDVVMIVVIQDVPR